MNSSEKHTITALVEDRAGVLNRISSMFRRRGYNISSLAVGKSEAEGLSRMTFVVDGDTKTVEMVVKNFSSVCCVSSVHCSSFLRSLIEPWMPRLGVRKTIQLV